MCNLSPPLFSAPPPNKWAGVAVEALFANALLGAPHLELGVFGSCLSLISGIRALAMQMANSPSNARCRAAAHLACGFGGFTVGATLAGFLPILSRGNADAAFLSHPYLTGGFSPRGGLALVRAVRFFAVHLLTIGFPCQTYSSMGKQQHGGGGGCLVGVGVALVLESGAVMVLASSFFYLIVTFIGLT